MNNGHKIAQPIWRILGGMGPLASAEFLTSTYKLSLGRTRTKHAKTVFGVRSYGPR
jgi:hypothetical protein